MSAGTDKPDVVKQNYIEVIDVLIDHMEVSDHKLLLERILGTCNGTWQGSSN